MKLILLSELLCLCSLATMAFSDGVTFTKAYQSPKRFDNLQCFSGVFEFDFCPAKATLRECLKCCSRLEDYYDKAPSKHVCVASCVDAFPDKLRLHFSIV